MLEQIGLNQVDFVTGPRTGAEYRYDTSTVPADLAVKRRTWSAWVIVVVVAAAALALLAGWWLRKRLAKGEANAGA